jgi:DNA-binding NtrC family response regulator
LLARQYQWVDSLTCVDELLAIGKKANDEHVLATATLFKIEVLSQLDNAMSARPLIEAVVPSVAHGTPEVFALYERALACLMVGTGDSEAGIRHRDRAGRIIRGLQNVPAEIELSRSWESARSLAASKPLTAVPPNRQGANVLQGIAALMMYAGRPELLAPELVAVLEHTGVASSAHAVARADAGREEMLASFGEMPADADNVRVFPLGTARNRTIEVRVHALPDFESLATLNGVTMLLGTIRDLELAKAEREERLTLWPSEELPLDNQDAIITGHMRELMAFARKVASTNVPVLITGESGTGKEIFARAIHSYSTRARRPFVPLNCTAVPRDLLESQLFGHRRGAFTGADRDHLGVIRAAKDGTLFLDEIGELSLELQPKFLRFLESGEINPLGETSPFTIDVRIVAATNANLEHLVEAGKFREDLYYRLNVVSIAVPPLRERRDEIPSLVHHFVAKAAAEFGKGRIRVAEETLEHLQLFAWPGNIRQLQNELRRMVALADVDAVLRPSALAAPIRHQEPTSVAIPQTTKQVSVALSEKLPPAISRIEREMIQAALHANSGRAEATAKALGISRKGLYLKRQRLGI